MVVSSSVSEMDVTFILSEIGRAYPALSEKLSSLPEHERSDFENHDGLGTHVVDLFEEGHIEAVRPAFELVERLISGDTESERQRPSSVSLKRSKTWRLIAPVAQACSSSSSEESLSGPGRNSTQHGAANELGRNCSSETGASLQPKWWQFCAGGIGEHRKNCWVSTESRTPEDHRTNHSAGAV